MCNPLLSMFVGRAYEEYRGIPFAEPPVRWKKPEAASNWEGVRDASQYADSCISVLGPVLPPLTGNPNETDSENCLYLNVYVPGSVKSIG